MWTELMQQNTEIHDLGPIDRIPLGEGRRFEVAGVAVAVFRSRTGDLFAVQADCPHKGGPLADGITGAGRVVCPLHGYAFDLSSGKALRNPCSALRTYPVTLTPDRRIRLEVGSTDPGEARAEHPPPVCPVDPARPLDE